MPHDVFVSHSSKDKAAADLVCAALEQAGIHVWIAPRDILPGQSWGASIVKAITECRTMVLILSSASNDSPQVMREVERAVSKRTSIIPVRIEDMVPTESMEYFLGTTHWLDAFGPALDSKLQKLVQTVQATLEIPVGAAMPDTAPARGSGPVRGPASSRRPPVALGLSLGIVAVLLAGAAWWMLHKPPAPDVQTAVTAPPAQSAPAPLTAALSPTPVTKRPRHHAAKPATLQSPTQDSSVAAVSAAPVAEPVQTAAPQTAVNPFKQAAQQSGAAAKSLLTGLLQSGRNLAQKTLQKVNGQAADADPTDADSETKLGTQYMNGTGVTRDYQHAASLFWEAAQQGDAEAQTKLGTLYQNGWGMPADAAQAASWYRKAAEQGYAEAQLDLGILYEYGLGVKRDYGEAASWYRQAAAGDNTQAKRRLQALCTDDKVC